MDDDSDDHVLCATYTHARRHPLVLGHIAGWTPPFQLSLAQLGVLVGTLYLEMQFWDVWAKPFPPPVALVIALVVPSFLAWFVRRARFEGRTLMRSIGGYLVLMATPRNGRVRGRTFREPAPSTPLRASVFVAPAPWAERR